MSGGNKSKIDLRPKDMSLLKRGCSLTEGQETSQGARDADNHRELAEPLHGTLGVSGR